LAAGKSTVGSWLAGAGFRVVDADRLVAELYEPGQPGAEVVSTIFGASVLDSDGRVDRAMLAQKVFADPEARNRLEAAVHPLVRGRFQDLAEVSSGIIVLEATLLVEADFAPMFDFVVTIEADPELRIHRAVERGLGIEAAKARLDVQGGTDDRIAAADVVIWNNGDLDELRARTERLIDTLAGRAEDHD
jgi:dephospho-CoA kinase